MIFEVGLNMLNLYFYAQVLHQNKYIQIILITPVEVLSVA